MRLFIAAIVFFVLPVAGFARTIVPEDLVRLRNLSDLAISNDGKHVVFAAGEADVATNRYRSVLFLASTGEPDSARQLTRPEGDAADSNPVWSPNDRTIVFVRSSGKSPQIYAIDTAGGEAQRLTNAEHGATRPVWSHDGTRIAYAVKTVDAPPPAHIDWRKTGFSAPPSDRKTDVRYIDKLDFSLNGPGFTYASHSHIWVMRADGSAARALTSGGEWSEENAAWSYDDATIAFDSTPREDVEGLDHDLYTIPVAGGATRHVAVQHRHAEGPVWTHGGRLLYLAKDHNDPGETLGVAIVSTDGTHDRTIVPQSAAAIGDAVLTDTKEAGAGCGPSIDAHDRSFVALISTAGATEVRKFDVAGGGSTKLIGMGNEILECSISADGSKIAFTASDHTHPAEVYVSDLAAHATRRLTDVNAAWLAETTPANAEPFTVKDPAGFNIQAWIMRPPGAAAGRKYPTLLEIHGGPETEFGNSFFHEFQVLAARGYNVVFANPRGSLGYGYPLTEALAKNWGQPMFEDEMAVADAVVKRPDVDPARLGMLGGSYGGYAVLWIAGHSNRFKAALAERPISNMVSQALTIDSAAATSEKYSWGEAWDHPAAYWQMSPLAYVKDVNTPLMLIHSDEDIRCPIGETLQEYSALRILKKPVELVEFPRENHDLNRTGEPRHRIERLHIIADWFDRFLKP